MTREGSTPGASRRRVLALVGTAMLSGCNDVPRLGSGSESAPTIEATRLQSAVADDRPSVPGRLPVEIAPAFLDRSFDRAQRFLDAVPSSLDSQQIPNGAIRRELSREHERAAEQVERARDAPTAFERLSKIRHARSDARYVAGAWRFIDGDATRDSMRAAASEVAAEVETAVADHTLVGEDRVRATRVHAAVGRLLDGAAEWAEIPERPRRYAADNPLAVGEAAEDLERAVSSLENAVHILERFESSLDAGRDLTPVVTDAREALRDDLEDVETTLAAIDPEAPWGDADVGQTALGDAIDDLYQRVRPERRFENVPSSAPAQDLLWIHETLALVRGFERLRERAANDPVRITTAGDVRTVRSEAIEAVRASRDETPESELTRPVLSRLASRLAHADRRIQRQSGDVDPDRVRYEVADYFRVTAVARELPDVSNRVAATIRGA